MGPHKQVPPHLHHEVEDIFPVIKRCCFLLWESSLCPRLKKICLWNVCNKQRAIKNNYISSIGEKLSEKLENYFGLICTNPFSVISKLFSYFQFLLFLFLFSLLHSCLWSMSCFFFYLKQTRNAFWNGFQLRISIKFCSHTKSLTHNDMTHSRNKATWISQRIDKSIFFCIVNLSIIKMTLDIQDSSRARYIASCFTKVCDILWR